MGNHIHFVRTQPNHWGHEHPDHGEIVGRAYFSSWSADRQQRIYGICWYDCVITDDNDESDPEEWWQPDWSTALERVRELAAKITDAYDIEHVPDLVKAIEFCARPENAKRCWVMVS